MELIQQNAPTSSKETHWILESGGFDVLATVGNIESDWKKDRKLAKLFAASPQLRDVCECLAKRDCEYNGSAGCDMLPQGVRRNVCLPCKARMVLADLN